MLYSQISPMLDTIRKMVDNGESRETILKLMDAMYPEFKKTLLYSDIKSCTACELYACNHTPFEGPVNSPIMFVGEAAGGEEEKQGKPFVGPAGAIFNNMLQMAAEKINPRWARENVFVTNTVKCRPTDTGSSNRTPNAKEVASCKRFLDKEIELVQPKIIICVGNIAASTLIHPNFKVGDEHGKFFGETPRLMTIYHPSYVLRTQSENPAQANALKKEMWADIVKANEYLESLK